MSPSTARVSPQLANLFAGRLLRRAPASGAGKPLAGLQPWQTSLAADPGRPSLHRLGAGAGFGDTSGVERAFRKPV